MHHHSRGYDYYLPYSAFSLFRSPVPHSHHVHIDIVEDCSARHIYRPIHVSGYVPHLVGLFLFGASLAFLAAFILPIVAKVLLSLVLIAGAVTVGAAVYHSLTR